MGGLYKSQFHLKSTSNPSMPIGYFDEIKYNYQKIGEKKSRN